jgi:hypothetical protein
MVWSPLEECNICCSEEVIPEDMVTLGCNHRFLSFELHAFLAFQHSLAISCTPCPVPCRPGYVVIASAASLAPTLVPRALFVAQSSWKMLCHRHLHRRVQSGYHRPRRKSTRSGESTTELVACKQLAVSGKQTLHDLAHGACGVGWVYFKF